MQHTIVLNKIKKIKAFLSIFRQLYALFIHIKFLLLYIYNTYTK